MVVTGMSQNQCDGCMSGLTLVGGIHVDHEGKAVMVCQRNRYNEGEKKFGRPHSMWERFLKTLSGPTCR